MSGFIVGAQVETLEVTDTHLEIAEETGLFWANTTFGGIDGLPEYDGCYLFMPGEYLEPFYLISEKLCALNNFSFSQLVAARALLNLLKLEYVKAEKDKSSEAELLDILSDDSQQWEELNRTVVIAVPILMLQSFVDWGLKMVVRNCTSKTFRRPDRRRSEILQLLDFLQSEWVIEIKRDEWTDQALFILGNARNKFAHGDWEEFSDISTSHSLRDWFRAVSLLFEAVEKAYRQSQTNAEVP